LQQKGVGTIILILALTGWTGPFRLMRAEYLKHKTVNMCGLREPSAHWRKMFVHIFRMSAMLRWYRFRYWWSALSNRK
jgi:peptide/nickel transport system permease protein